MSRMSSKSSKSSFFGNLAVDLGFMVAILFIVFLVYNLY